MNFLKTFLFVWLLIFTTPSHTSDYCLGDWSEDAQTYCDNLMRYVQVVALDRKAGPNRSRGSRSRLQYAGCAGSELRRVHLHALSSIRASRGSGSALRRLH